MLPERSLLGQLDGLSSMSGVLEVQRVEHLRNLVAVVAARPVHAAHGEGLPGVAEALQHDREIVRCVHVVVIEVSDDLTRCVVASEVPLQADAPLLLRHAEVPVEEPRVRASLLLQECRGFPLVCVDDDKLAGSVLLQGETVPEEGVEATPAAGGRADDRDEDPRLLAVMAVGAPAARPESAIRVGPERELHVAPVQRCQGDGVMLREDSPELRLHVLVLPLRAAASRAGVVLAPRRALTPGKMVGWCWPREAPAIEGGHGTEERREAAATRLRGPRVVPRAGLAARFLLLLLPGRRPRPRGRAARGRRPAAATLAAQAATAGPAGETPLQHVRQLLRPR
mmetsp:Transcript_109952/g.342797  ORF Transcript_109952/g.342797 Transcript_109952/m.342797 type:complete len:340 (+) Transcript_109952:614-1633(+)